MGSLAKLKDVKGKDGNSNLVDSLARVSLGHLSENQQPL